MKWEFDILYALQKIHQPVLDHIMTGLSTICLLYTSDAADD